MDISIDASAKRFVYGGQVDGSQNVMEICLAVMR